MTRYVVLFRGINVSASSRVAMTDLRSAVSALGYTQVRTVLNSGNLLLESAGRATDEVRIEIERALFERLGVPARAFVYTGEEFRAAAANPLSRLAAENSRLITGFLADSSDVEALRPLEACDWAPEALALGERAAYMWCVYGVVGSALLRAVDAIVGSRMTTRSAGTVERVAALLTRLG